MDLPSSSIRRTVVALCGSGPHRLCLSCWPLLLKSKNIFKNLIYEAFFYSSLVLLSFTEKKIYIYYLNKLNRDSFVCAVLYRELSWWLRWSGIHLPMQGTCVPSWGWEDPMEKGMATHSSILAWEIPWTEEPGGLPSTGSQRIGHDWATLTLTLWVNRFFSPLCWVLSGGLMKSKSWRIGPCKGTAELPCRGSQVHPRALQLARRTHGIQQTRWTQT